MNKDDQINVNVAFCRVFVCLLSAQNKLNGSRHCKYANQRKFKESLPFAKASLDPLLPDNITIFPSLARNQYYRSRAHDFMTFPIHSFLPPKLSWLQHAIRPAMSEFLTLE